MLIVLDNAESILDPQGTDAQGIYEVVEELSGFNNICLIITSRITIIPPDCRTLEIPTLSMGAARDTFYRICQHDEKPQVIDRILKQLDFHPLSVVLLATVAHQNMWDVDRLDREWRRRQTAVLQTEHKKSLATAIELSLGSPMFKELGRDARELLGVVAFFPQGVDECKLDWLFPTISDSSAIFDKFSILSLTFRSNGFISMLAPLRDYLTPKDPQSSQLLRLTKDRYFSRMSVKINPNQHKFDDSRWITSEDVNVEHLLVTFGSTDTDSDGVWNACADFLRHLAWHKHRHTVLRERIEGLPDSHRLKPKCLFELAQLLYLLGNYVEQKQVLTHLLGLQRKRGDDYEVAQTLGCLSSANRPLNLYKEGIGQAREALEIFERLGNTVRQASCWDNLALLLHAEDRLDDAEEAALEALRLLPKKGEEFLVCQSHRVLGDIYISKCERERAVTHFEEAREIASRFGWDDQLFWTHYSLAWLSFKEEKLEDAHAHIEKAKLHGTGSAYFFGCAVLLQAKTWYQQRRFDKAMFEVLRARDIFERLGAANLLEICERYVGRIERAMGTGST